MQLGGVEVVTSCLRLKPLFRGQLLQYTDLNFVLCKALPSFNLLAKNIITYEVFFILFLEMVLIQDLPWKWKASTELQVTDFVRGQ